MITYFDEVIETQYTQSDELLWLVKYYNAINPYGINQ